MNNFPLTVVKTLLLATCATAAATQDADRAAQLDSDAVHVVASGLDESAGLHPILRVQYPVAVLRARPDAVYAVLAGLRRPDRDAASIQPIVVLGCGRIDADGVVEIALPLGDLATMESADVVLQAAVLADGESLKTSEIVALRRRPADGDVADRDTGGIAGPATIGAPRFGRAMISADSGVGGGDGTVGPATIGAPRFGRSGPMTIGAPRFGR